MNHHLNESEDEFFGELLHAPEDASSDWLRKSVLSQTGRVLCRRRWLRRAGWAVSLAGCYAAGALSMAAWRPGGDSKEVVISPAVAILEQALANGATIIIEEEASQQPPAQKTPKQPPPKNRFEALCRQADRILETGDIEEAVKLYARALRLATPEELNISIEKDNWLLMTLKDNRLEEIEHDNNKT